MPGNPLAWLDGCVDTAQIAALANVRRQAKRILDEQNLFHYTGHGIEHSDRVIEILRKLIADNLAGPTNTRLNDLELISLLAASYLHDTGMQTLLFEQSSEAAEYNWQLAEQVREKHAENSERLIRESLGSARHKFPTMGLEQDPILEALADNISKIVRLHSGEMGKLPDAVMAFGKQIRLAFLVSVFRLADGLDLDESRVLMERLKRFRIPERSQLHWWRHHYVRGVEIENGLIAVHMAFPPSAGIFYIDYMKELVLDEIRRELWPRSKILFSNGVRFILDEQVQVTQDETLSRQRLPTGLEKFIEEAINARGESFGKIMQRSAGILPTPATGRDWISYWRFRGNPWADIPLKYRDEEFVETANIRQMLDELKSILKGRRGDLKLVTGDVGSGKTTFFNIFEDALASPDVRARYLDISEEIYEIHHPKEIYDWLFRHIHQVLARDSTEEFSESKLRAQLRTYGQGKLVLGIDNVDRFTRPEEQEIIRQFFTMSQGLLQDVKLRCILVIACSPRWKSMLQSPDLHYLGGSGAWVLRPFKKDEIKELLSKRLAMSGVSFDHVFDESVLETIHKLSEGNPRRVVQIAEDLCKKAAARRSRKIDSHFIDKELLHEVIPSMRKEIERIAASSDYYTEATARFYHFNERMERERLVTETGWDLVLKLSSGQGLLLDSVDEGYLGALNYVAARFPREIEIGKFEVDLVLRPEIKDFCGEWTRTGYSFRDFMDAFRLKPWLPMKVKAQVAARIFDVTATGEAEPFLSASKEGFDRVLTQTQNPVLSILLSWNTVELLLKALYLQHGVMSREEAGEVRTETGGVKSFDEREGLILGANKVLKNLTRLSQVTGYIRYFDEIVLIAKKREKVLKSPARFLTNFSEQDAELCKLALRKVFMELLTLFRAQRSWKPPVVGRPKSKL